ncbi:hypothetical protein Pta02_12900 [Planobispora takensis]|uniref:Uncharacterized protein n=1 Tax=Planobispora takensis TaxID=1367882 RepID=A0A8J3SRM0_9ACTN|nr:hypothetical protein Pta02_12900 [Planobispora takensis]
MQHLGVEIQDLGQGRGFVVPVPVPVTVAVAVAVAVALTVAVVVTLVFAGMPLVARHTPTVCAACTYDIQFCV